MGKMSSSGYQQESICFECLPFVFDFKRNRTGSSSVRTTVHTVRACVKIPRNLGETINYSILLPHMSSVPRSQDMSVKLQL